MTVPHDARRLDSAFVAALLHDSGSCVTLWTTAGILLPPAVDPRRVPTQPDSPFGRSIHDLLRPDLAAERLRFIQQTASSGLPFRFKQMYAGQWVRVTMRPVEHPEPNTAPSVLVVTRFPMRPDPDDHALPLARTVDLGALGVLSPRELQLLRLIALGLTTREISKELCRAEKTVEWHRWMIGSKLAVNSRVELANLATHAGLNWMTPQEIEHVNACRPASGA